MRTIRILLVAAALALVASGSAFAQTTPRVDAQAPLDRAAMRALPAVYRLQAVLFVRRASDGRNVITVDRELTFDGSAFGVGPGVVVAARHVVRPSADELYEALVDAGATGVASLQASNVRVDAAVRRITLTRALPADADPEANVRGYSASVLATSRGTSDLALLRTSTPTAPTLTLDDTTTRDLPVASVGFGEQPAHVPAIRTGTLQLSARIGRTGDEGLVTADVPVRRGDSGAPVVDADGRVHGVVIRLVASSNSAVITRSGAIRDLAADADVELSQTAAHLAYDTGLVDYWARRYDAAALGLRSASGGMPEAGWIRELATTADRLADTDYRIDRGSPWRLPLVLTGVAALAIAMALALGAMRAEPRDDRPTPD